MDRLLTLFAEFNIDNGTGAGVGVDPPWHVDVVLAHIRDCKPWCLRVCGTARSVDCIELNWMIIISGVIATNGLTWRKQSCFLNLGQVQQISNGAHRRGVFPRHLPPPPFTFKIKYKPFSLDEQICSPTDQTELNSRKRNCNMAQLQEELQLTN